MKLLDLERYYKEIAPQMSAFLGVFFVVMVIGYGILYMIDFVPEKPSDENMSSTSNEERVVHANETETPVHTPPTTEESNLSPMPISITIDRLDRTITVLNPTSNSYAALDDALLRGVVRHPDSANLNDRNGNMLIMGHSSYLRNVMNRNFQAFNGLQNLTWGDTIRVRSVDTEYTYRVDRVYEDKASVVNIPTRAIEQKLTLVTCNTFGAREDRFIVEATLVSKKAL